MDPLKLVEKFSADSRIIKQIILLILDIERLSSTMYNQERGLHKIFEKLFHDDLDTQYSFFKRRNYN